MFNHLQKQATTNQPAPLYRRILTGLLKAGWRQKRCWAAVAVILSVFVALHFVDSPTKSEQNLAARDNWQQDELIEENSNGLEAGILGGLTNLGTEVIPAAEASIDFSADDELENQDLAILEGSGLLAPDLAGGTFAGMQREATIYVVQSGDTPSDIAVKFGINTDTVLSANNLRDGDLIKPGQQLLILPINGVRIKVAAKDTVDSLAKKYNGKVGEIMAFNNLSDVANLTPGSFIIIPDGEMPALPKPKVTAPKYAKGSLPVIGWLIVPTTGRNWGRVHNNNGVDIANACSSPIYAAAAGTVTLSDGVGWNGGFGKYITIKHQNGIVTLYAHASRLLVGAGERVEQGQLIALMGTTGRSTGCHLHFEVHGAKNPLAR